jgi:hypothetical protein
MDRMAIVLMLLAAAMWGYAAFRELDGSDRLEWALAGLLLNAAAMVLWNLERGPAGMLEHWLHYALAASASTLLLHLCAALRDDGGFQARRFLPPVAYVALTLSLSLAAPGSYAGYPVAAAHPAEARADAGSAIP